MRPCVMMHRTTWSLPASIARPRERALAIQVVQAQRTARSDPDAHSATNPARKIAHFNQMAIALANVPMA